VRVGLKVKQDPIPLCYCFGFDEANARDEIAHTGQTSTPQRIAALIKQGMCACPERNPSGACCLGEVNKAIERLLTEHQATSDKILKEICRKPCLNKCKRSQAWQIVRTWQRLKKGDLNHGSQTMDVACGRPLRMWQPTRVPGTTLNGLFTFNEVSSREAAGLTGRALPSSLPNFRG
jgi:hypothetical protein